MFLIIRALIVLGIAFWFFNTGQWKFYSYVAYFDNEEILWQKPRSKQDTSRFYDYKFGVTETEYAEFVELLSVKDGVEVQGYPDHVSAVVGENGVVLSTVKFAYKCNVANGIVIDNRFICSSEAYEHIQRKLNKIRRERVPFRSLSGYAKCKLMEIC
jgi:hypothetical protein